MEDLVEFEAALDAEQGGNSLDDSPSLESLPLGSQVLEGEAS
jgi:hypothetical protein